MAINYTTDKLINVSMLDEFRKLYNNNVIGTLTESTVAAEIAAAKQAAIKAATYDDTAVKADIKTNADDIDALEGKVSTLVGSVDGDDAKSVRTISSEEVAKVVASAPEKFDTLKEIADWIENDTTGAAKMANDISALQTQVGKEAEGEAAATGLVKDIRDLQEAVGEGGAVADQIKDAIEGLDAEQSQTAGADGLALSITEVDGKITAISGSIKAETYDAYGSASTAKSDVLGGYTGTVKDVADLVGTKSVATQITEAVEALDATPSQAAGTDGLALSLTQVDGKITAINGSIAAETYAGYEDLSKLATTAKTVVGALNELHTAAEAVDYSGKADKVASATAGNFAGLDAQGNLTDSGKKAADFDVAGAAAGVQGDTTETVASVNTKLESIQIATKDDITNLFA